MPHYEVTKSWGKEVWYWNSDRYCYKGLHIKKGEKCSFHYHEKKDEIFHVIEGAVTVRYSFGDDLEKAGWVTLQKNEIFHVTPLMRHQMIADQGMDVVLVEVSTTHYEDDSFRIQEQKVGFDLPIPLIDGGGS